MKAYLLGQHSRQVAKWKAVNQPNATAAGAAATTPNSSNKDIVKALQSGNPTAAAPALAGIATAVATGKTDALPHIPTALEKVEPADIPLIKSQYEKSLGMIDEILKREPEDVWSICYGAHLRAEYTGDIDPAMNAWRAAAKKWPNNPAPFFFLGEGYLKKGDLKESLNNVGKAIALRALGN
jgi:tetratricopeptide (TPR) repeat protein